jgi:MSHA biogenesis protein MshM
MGSKAGTGIHHASYKKRLGLNKNPFSSEIADTFFFEFQALTQRLNVLEQMVQGADFLILVIGELNSGKTTLLTHFLMQHADKWRVCRIRSKEKDNDASPGPIDIHPAFILKDDPNPVVMLDDAHNRSGEELKLLFQHAGSLDDARKLKRIILFTEPQIKNRVKELTALIPPEAVINTLYMPALTQEETGKYIQHRLRVAGYKGKPLFSSEDIKEIFSETGGIPGDINKQALEMIQKGNDKGKTKSGGGVWRKILLAAGGLVGAALVIFYLINTHPSFLKDIGGKTEKTHDVRSDVVKKNKKADTDAGISSEKKQNGHPVSGDGISEKGKTEAVSSGRTLEVKEEIETDSSVPSEKTVDWKIPAEEKKIGPDKEATAEKTPLYQFRDHGIKAEGWLLVQNPDHFTLQIFSVSSKDALFTYVNENEMNDLVAFCRTVSDKGTAYKLFYGIYKTRKAAVAAARKLPKEVKKFSPWVRKMSLIQTIINNGQQHEAGD